MRSSALRCCTRSRAAWAAASSLLAGAYAAAIVFGWPVLAMALLGLAETAFNIRGRVARKRRPADHLEPDHIQVNEGDDTWK